MSYHATSIVADSNPHNYRSELKRLDILQRPQWTIYISNYDRSGPSSASILGESTMLHAGAIKESDEAFFRFNARLWKEQTGHMSSITAKSRNAHYRAIIGMGKSAIPLIVDEMKRGPDHWFVALREITGADPIQPDERGNVRAMTSSWLKWAEQSGVVKHDV